MIFGDNFNSLLTYQETYFGITLYSMEFGLPLIFVKEYKNAYLQKQDILLENKGKTGIYCWENTLNGKIYIGSAPLWEVPPDCGYKRPFKKIL